MKSQGIACDREKKLQIPTCILNIPMNKTVISHTKTWVMQWFLPVVHLERLKTSSYTSVQYNCIIIS